MRHRSKRQRWVIQKPKAENRNSRNWKPPRIETSNFRNFGCQFRFRKDQPKMETFRLSFPTSSRKPQIFNSSIPSQPCVPSMSFSIQAHFLLQKLQIASFHVICPLNLKTHESSLKDYFNEENITKMHKN